MPSFSNPIMGGRFGSIKAKKNLTAMGLSSSKPAARLC